MRNSDYWNGMRVLRKMARESGVEIRRCGWLPVFMCFLSLNDACTRFVTNLIKNNRIKDLVTSATYYDVFHNKKCYAFSWSETAEGYNFWQCLDRKFARMQCNPMVEDSDSMTFTYIDLKNLIVDEEWVEPERGDYDDDDYL